ncbi:MAG: HNH endonuclease [Paludibacteraceae bacterium]|nr:HNH endonuclease [Paludibacteraceae bacterium]
MGIFFSLSSRGLNQIKCYHVKNFKAKPNVHSYYPRMCGFIGNPYCHLLVAIAWVGPRRFNHECHHLNGNHTDNRASNLIWLSPEAHRRFDAALRHGLVLERDLRSTDEIMEYEMTHHMEI